MKVLLNMCLNIVVGKYKPVPFQTEVGTAEDDTSTLLWFGSTVTIDGSAH